MKKFLFFLLFLLPWYLHRLLFSIDLNYYNQLKLIFHFPPFFFSILWSIIYLGIACVSTKIYLTYGKSGAKEYFRSLLFNYIIHILFTYFFFTMKSPFLGFTDSIMLFISTLICYYETRELDESLSKYFIPYLIITLSSTILLLFAIFMNL